ncbi:MAG TPA: hypothetical protein VFZ25_19635 [Chloroflexota bacterium]|nr:hypothetical protein [Chloroflexota bacterium]
MLQPGKSSRRVVLVGGLVGLVGASSVGVVLAQGGSPTATPVKSPASSGSNATNSGAAISHATTAAGSASGSAANAKHPDAIARATAMIDRAKAEVSAAQGKVDVSYAPGWVVQAAAERDAARGAQAGGKTAPARELAAAAQELALAAQLLVRQTPANASATTSGTGPSNISPQTRTSQELAQVYRGLVNQGFALQSTGLGGSWADNLTQAKSLYQAAFTAYNAGDYTTASRNAITIGHLTRAINHGVMAETDPTRPVTVPAPKF